MGAHTEHEDHPWSISIPDHPERTESAEFRAAKEVAHKILATTTNFYASATGTVQQHHGGSLWVFDGTGWFLLLNLVGIEWSAQFAADPAKIDLLRQNARRLYTRFPETLAELVRLGYDEARAILETPITDADGVARWTDSIYNACVPLAAGAHTGVLSLHQPAGGLHHYPQPVCNIQHFKRDDFTLWVIDPESGEHVAVVPMAPRGSGDGRVEVVHVAPGTALHRAHHQAQGAEKRLVLDADHSLARQAFALQTSREPDAT